MDASWRSDVNGVLKTLQVDVKSGLSEQEVEKRRKVHGRNEIPAPKGASVLAMIIEQFQDLLVLILLGAAIVSFILAWFEKAEDRFTAFVEPAVIMTILIANATVGVIQESNAEKAIEKLKESEARDAQVIRDGLVKTVHSQELVPGDVVIVAVGDKVPADCRLVSLSSATILADESMLTGESEAALKHADTIDKSNAVNQDKRNILFSGTLIVRGKGTGVVVQIGPKTEMGQIAKDLQQDDEKTPLQKKLDEFGEQLSKVIGVICIVVWLINIGHFTDPVHGSAIRGAIYYFKIAVALAVAAIPEGLPAVVTTCLALGTMKMAKKNAIVRSLPSVETLGCTTVICSDKTGTLTTNQMSVQKVLAIDSVRGGKVAFTEYLVEGDSFNPVGRILESGSRKVLSSPAVQDDSLSEIGKISALCNESTLLYKIDEKTRQGQFGKTGAPTEAALKVLAEKIGVPDEKSAEKEVKDPNQRCQVASQYWDDQYTRKYMLEFDRNRKSMSVLCTVNGSKGESWLFVKGAPESVLDRCTDIRGSDGQTARLTPATRKDIDKHLEGYAQEGLRVLALAELQNPSQQQDFKTLENFVNIEQKLTFVGLTCMLDPPRKEVYESIGKCRTAGIRVIVITGDNKITAESICRRIGVFATNANLEGLSYTGAEFETMTEAKKNEAVKRASLFSRVEPRHKLELVSLLKKQGEVVAMTGDGVNDATALRRADIGIAMGSGTDVAREASDMVLQDDNFATIVMAVEEGRAIYANTKQFIRYLISSNIGEVACIFLTAALGTPEALIPVQLLWVNLVTDGLPATALGFNPPDKDIMLRSPRGKDEAIINGWMFFRYVVIGVYVGVGTVAGFIWWYMYATQGPHLTWKQLTGFHGCNATNPLYKGIDCAIFHDARPATVSLSILVLIEMFNAMNALSENQSLFTVSPLSNLWVVAACALSLALHFAIVYIPFFANIFHVTPLNREEWKFVFYLSIPVWFLDEILKFISRQQQARASGERQKKGN